LLFLYKYFGYNILQLSNIKNNILKQVDAYTTKKTSEKDKDDDVESKRSKKLSTL
jgi:hypothetical protein